MVGVFEGGKSSRSFCFGMSNEVMRDAFWVGQKRLLLVFLG